MADGSLTEPGLAKTSHKRGLVSGVLPVQIQRTQEEETLLAKKNTSFAFLNLFFFFPDS